MHPAKEQKKPTQLLNKFSIKPSSNVELFMFKL